MYRGDTPQLKLHQWNKTVKLFGGWLSWTKETNYCITEHLMVSCAAGDMEVYFRCFSLVH